MKKNIYKTQSGITNFDEADAHLDELTEDDWVSISINQKLSESFIEKYADKVDWEWINKYQTFKPQRGLAVQINGV